MTAAEKTIEHIAGIPFAADPSALTDMAVCQLCGQTVDVGGQIKEHVMWHEAERLERLYEH